MSIAVQAGTTPLDLVDASGGRSVGQLIREAGGSVLSEFDRFSRPHLRSWHLRSPMVDCMLNSTHTIQSDCATRIGVESVWHLVNAPCP